MHLMMITLLTVGSAVGQVQTTGKESAAMAVEAYDECYDEMYGPGGRHANHGYKHAVKNTSPQTCYSPRFGCYHSNERHMNRYPAFHGTFYRHAYNYRNYFDYPWHADMHEPTSLFSYNVGEDAPPPPPGPATSGAPVTPPMPPQARRQPVPAQPAPAQPQTRPASRVEVPVSSPPPAAPAAPAAPASKRLTTKTASSSKLSDRTSSLSREISTRRTTAVIPASAELETRE